MSHLFLSDPNPGSSGFTNKSDPVRDLHCLFCYCPEVSRTIEGNQSVANLLESIFEKLCATFKVDFPRKCWNFSREIFPFCDQCKCQISRLFELHQELEVIQHQIQSISATLAGAVLDSQQQWDHPLAQVTSTKNNPKEPGKYLYFRRKIRQSLEPQLVLEDCQKCVPPQAATSPELYIENNRIHETTEDSSKESSHIQIQNRRSKRKKVERPLSWKDSALGDREGIDQVQSLDFPEPSETLLEDIHDEYGNDFEGGFPCSDSPGEYKLKVLVNEDEINDIDKIVVKKEIKDDAECAMEGSSEVTVTDLSTNTKSNRRRKSTKKMTLKPKHKKRRLVHDGGNKYRFCNVPFVTAFKAVHCRECSFNYVYDGDKVKGFYGIRKHIQLEHTDNTQDPTVFLLDSATRTYSYFGFEFTLSEDGLTFTCSTCTQECVALTKMFGKRSWWSNMIKHIQVKHLGTRAGRCDICEKEVNDLKQHRADSHTAAGAAGIVCEKCGKSFSGRVSLSQHMRRTHQDVPKKCLCEQCGKRFFAPMELAAHMTSHTKEKNVVCGECGKNFARKSTLATHFGIYHAVKKFACTLCDRKFGLKFLLAAHIKQVHEGIKPPPRKRRRQKKKKE